MAGNIWCDGDVSASLHDGLSDRGRAATIHGVAAILLWSTLATLAVVLSEIPPLQLTAMSFLIASLVGWIYVSGSGRDWPAATAATIGACTLGVYGLLGYHVAYFFALQNAPPAEANLINYLWPMLIVMFSGLLPKTSAAGRLKWNEMAGAALGFLAIAVLLLTSASDPEAPGRHPANAAGDAWSGYAAALAAAVVWASYSVGSRLFANVPVSAVVFSCALTAAGALALHVSIERTVLPANPWAWLAILAQGAGPVGLAFYLWDSAMKHGYLRPIGVMANATPVLSTGLLAATGQGNVGPWIWLSVFLLSAGMVLVNLRR